MDEFLYIRLNLQVKCFMFLSLNHFIECLKLSYIQELESEKLIYMQLVKRKNLCECNRLMKVDEEAHNKLFQL
jgi:hypothetical protein